MAGPYQKILTGVFGDPVDDNPTVLLVEAAFAATGVPGQYITMQVKKGDLKAAVEGAKAMNFLGFNTTMPHKIEMLDYLDTIAEDAKTIGAVNVITNQNGKLHGENTDGKGFLRCLQEDHIPVAGKNVVLLGAGGAARAIAVELANAGAKQITVVNRGRDRGEELTALLNEKTAAKAVYVQQAGTVDIPPETDILVNATPVGFVDPAEKPDIRYDALTQDMTVCDVIPNSMHTAFLQAARARGCRTIHGMQMLVWANGYAFELWTGKKAPVDIMMQALQKAYPES